MANKPVPTALKILRGNPSRRKMNKREPKPALGAEFPLWLNGLDDPDLRIIWGELAGLLNQSKVLTVSDGEALALLTHRVWMYRRASLALKDSLTYVTTTETGDEMRRPRPEVGILSDLGKQVRALLSDFGMNPSARTKVSMAGTSPHDGPPETMEELDQYLSGNSTYQP